MASNNLCIIIFILIILGLVIFFYYNRNAPMTEGYKNDKNIKNKDRHKKSDKIKKRVRFDDKIEYNLYNAIDVDKIVSDVDDETVNDKIDLDKIMPENEPVENSKKDIAAANGENDEEKTWESAFDKPLMDKSEKNKYYRKIQKNYDDYEKSLGEFGKYQTDDTTVIKTDITIDMFAPEKRTNSCKGKAIKDIYDDMVSGPKAKPKQVKCKTDDNVIYENESELNGGNIKGTNLSGFDGVGDGYQTADFSNEF